MKGFDADKERSERVYTLADFVDIYNQDLPEEFPRASFSSLKTFKKTYPSHFKDGKDAWSLEYHRKKVIDWLPQHLKTLAAAMDS